MKLVSIIGIFGLIASISCTDFLSVNPQSELTQEAFPSSPNDALHATNAVYSTLRNWHYHSGGFPILDIMSDDAHKGSNPNDALNTVGPYDNFMHATTQDGLDRWWNGLYQGIRRANVVIEKVPLITMDESLKNRYIGEAKFLRALYYFDLVRAFGGIPLVLTTNPEFRLNRSTVAEVYDVIGEDLRFAINNLPLKKQYTSQNIGRASSSAASVLLAKVLIFNNNFTEAEDLLLDVIQSGDYDLEPDYFDANGPNGEHGIESIFEIGAISTESGQGNQYANTQGVRGSPNRGWGFNQPSIDLRNAFEYGDVRRQATIIELGDVIDGITILGDSFTPDIIRDENGQIVRMEGYNRKVWIPGLSTDTQYGHNRRLIRYADALLLAAEALNENNKPEEALVFINQIRKRARGGNDAVLPDIIGIDKSFLREKILQERRVELALEGHRFWDLVRTQFAEHILAPYGFQKGKHELLPIPQSEIDLSKGSLIQNPNW